MHSTVILGLGPRIQQSAGEKRRDRRNTGQRRIQVEPMWVGALDQVDLPRSDVVFDGLLALDCLAHARELLEPDERVHAVAAREGGALAGLVLLDAFDQAIGDADVERASWLAGEDVGPIAAHEIANPQCEGVCGAMGPRDKPEDDIRGEVFTPPLAYTWGQVVRYLRRPKRVVTRRSMSV